MDWFIRLFKGVIIALGFILPGVSGGVLAAILGIYDRLLAFLAHIRENFKANFLYFLPVGIGGILGIGLLSAPLEYLLNHYQVPVLWAFAGAIIGSIPALWKEASSKENGIHTKADWTWLLLSFLVFTPFLYFMPDLFGTIPANFATFILAGFLIALGILVPGLSPSNFLLILGLYGPMLTGFKNFDILGVFLPITIGGIIAVLAFSKLMEYLLKHYYSYVYHCIIGIVLSSTLLILIPNQKASESISYAGINASGIFITIIMFILGSLLGLWMSKLENKYK
jgi:Predicted membrane protein